MTEAALNSQNLTRLRIAYVCVCTYRCASQAYADVSIYVNIYNSTIMKCNYLSANSVSKLFVV